MKLSGLIFDFDGLIVDTEYPIYLANREIYADHGHELELAKFVDCVGRADDEYDPMTILDNLCNGDIDWETVRAKRARLITELLEDAVALPGVVEVLEDARTHGVACAVASSSSHHWVDRWLGRLGLEDYFAHVFCRDDVERAKPAPDLFRAATRAIGHGSDRVLVFEDSENGLRAAIASENPCAVVPNVITEKSDFTGAAMKLGSLEEFSIAEFVAA